LVLGITATVSAFAASHATATTFYYGGTPFKYAAVQYLGDVTAGRPYPYGDQMPSVMYLESEPGTEYPYKMWWYGRYDANTESDIAPFNLYADDRIFFSQSKDGNSWSSPRIALKGLGGTAGEVRADDSLVGSPSVIRYKGTYYMFYEGYGNWMTTIVRSWSPERFDNLITSGTNWGDGSQYSGYNFEFPLGIAPYLVQNGTRPIYLGRVTYPGGKANSFLDRGLTKCSQGTLGSGEKWECLAGSHPVFWLYEASKTGRVPIYECFDTTTSNTFATNDPGCEGHGVPGAPDGGSYLLGYADAVTPSSKGEPVVQAGPDMAHANQNSIMLATSTDGEHWTRVKGADAGGALLAPKTVYTNLYPAPGRCGSSRDVHKSNGAAYPTALEREGYLELYFQSDADGPEANESPLTECEAEKHQPSFRVRIPMGEIGNPSAYASAKREGHALPGTDMKWSPHRHRYFEAFVEQGPYPRNAAGWLESPMLQWSSYNPNPEEPAWIEHYPGNPAFQLVRPWDGGRLPTYWSPKDFTGRGGNYAALLGNELGHTIDVQTPDPNDSPDALVYSRFDMFYGAEPNNEPASVFNSDIDHAQIFAYDVEPPKYRLIAKHSGKCMDVTAYSNADGAPIEQSTCRTPIEAFNQSFYLEPMGGSYYELISRNSRKCLDVTGASTSAGALLQQYTCLGAGQENQLWRMEPMGGGYSELISKRSGMCADVVAASTADGASIQQYPCLGSGQTNQLWKVEEVE
jgi:hypothetical protein